MDEYPVEIQQQPLPVAALVGCQQHHARIESLLSHLTPDISLPIAVPCFRVLSMSIAELDKLPPRKDKRTTYDGYVPQGILKAKWMRRQMFELPSVLALFVEWDETAKNFSTKETFDILGVIEAARALKQRTMKVMVIIVHSGKIGIEYEEAVVNIKRRVEMSDKNSTVSKLGIRWNAASVSSSPAAFSLEDFEGSVHRLEKQLMELSQQYYKDEAKRLKKELDLVNRRTHPQVCVRIHFKIGYLAEFRSDFASSIKYYTTSYNHLREVPKERDSPLEIKALADLMNFKLCKLYLVNGKGDLGINDAIVQFQKHARLYKQFYGPSKCLAEHWAWVSRQYQAMGELLERYAPQLKGGSVSSGLRHPIYYFESAATFAIQRKVHAHKASAELTQQDREAYAELKPIVLVSILPNMEYIGRHISPKSDHPLEDGATGSRTLEDEMEHLRMAIARENNVEHSANIIRLLNKAYSFCDAQRNSRQAAHLEATLGAELFAAGQHLQAKRFFDLVIPKFRRENWWALLATVLRRAIVCALNLGDPFDYLDYALELLQPRSPLTPQEKTALQANVVAAVLTPEEIRISPLSSSKAVNLETMDPNQALVTRLLRFEQATVAQGSSVDVVLAVTLHFPQPISLSRLLLEFDQPRSIGFGSTMITASALPFENSPAENTFDLRDTNHVEIESLILLPERSYTFRFRYHVPYNSEFVGKVECTRVVFELGPEGKALALAWTPIVATSFPPQFVDPETQAQQQAVNIVPLNSIIVTTPHSELEIIAVHQPPALVSEFYRIDVTLRNKGDAIHALVLRFAFDHVAQDGSSSFFIGLPLVQIEPSGLQVPEGIAAGAEWATTIYAYSPIATPEREIVINATFEAKGGKPMTQSSSVACPVVLPIAARCGFFSSSFASAADSAGSATLVADEECFVRVEVQSMCPYPVQVLSTVLEIPPELGVSKASTNTDMMNRMIVLGEKEKLTTWFTVVPKLSANEQSLGVFNLSWKRAPHPQLPADYLGRDDRGVESPTLIPPLKVIQSPFSATIDVPSQGITGRPLTLSLVVTNNTIRIEDFVLTVKDSEFFLCAGTMSSSFKVMPKSSYRLSYSLIPTAPGKIMVPHFQLVWKRVNKELQDTKQRRFVFVRPLIDDVAASGAAGVGGVGGSSPVSSVVTA